MTELETFEKISDLIVQAMNNQQPIRIEYSEKIAPAFEKASSILKAEMNRRDNVRRARQNSPAEP